MQAQVEKIGRDIEQERPLDGIRADEGDAMAAEQADEVWRDEAGMTNLDRVTQRTAPGRLKKGAAFEPEVVFGSQDRGGFGGAGQQREELVEQD